MSNHPFLKEALETHKSKMRKEGVSGEGDRARAKRIAYAGGGAVHSDVAEDRKLIHEEVKPSALKD